MSLQTTPDLHTNLVVEQGVEMGRPSIIQLVVQKSGGIVKEVLVTGRCTAIMRGILEVYSIARYL